MATTTTARPWTEREIQALRDGAGLVSWADIAASLGRTERAVRQKARRLGIDTGPGYTQFELAHHLGVSTGTIAAWRRRGLLLGSQRGRADWRYARRAVRSFVRAHADLIAAAAPAHVDLSWVVELLAGQAA